MKDTFWTQSYRSGFIHGYHERGIGEVIKAHLPDGFIKRVKSLRAAKLAISRHIGGRPVK